MSANLLLDDRALRALVQSKIFRGLNFVALVLRNLMYIRVACLVFLILVGSVMSWLYTSNVLSSKATISIRYTWMTWFGDTGLFLLILRLVTAIVLSLVFRAIRDQTELMVQDPSEFFKLAKRTDKAALARYAARHAIVR